MRKTLMAFMAGLMLASASPLSASAEIHEQTIRFASAGAEGSPLVIGQRKFAEIVKEKSGGKIDVKVFPAGMLGGDLQSVASLQGGLLQMSVMNAGLMASLAPDFAVLDLPFPFESTKDVRQGTRRQEPRRSRLLGTRFPQPDQQPPPGREGRRYRRPEDPCRAVTHLSRNVPGPRRQCRADALPRSLYRP